MKEIVKQLVREIRQEEEDLGNNDFITSSNAALRRQTLKKVQEKRKASKISDIRNLKPRGAAGTMQEFVSKVSEDYLPAYPVNEIGEYFLGKAFEGKSPLNIYERENLWKQWQTQGSPEVRQWSKEEFIKAGSVHKDPEEKAWYHGEPRAFYSQRSNRMTITPGNVDEFFSELAHSTQWKSQNKSQRISLWDRITGPYERLMFGEKVYDMPGTLEYGAHTLIEPKLTESFITSTPKSFSKSGVSFSDYNLLYKKGKY